ncbi:MAG: sugar metabolism transcriptional regulator [Gammaproteobacteria bacterium]|nr:MAG: sugar metabolism transcriptional regulator [Gammaproteobacteria bacterium]
MILTELRDYLREHGQASLQDMAVRFDMDASALRGALEHWIRKGKVRRLPPGTPCSGCTSCAPDTVELYAWVGEPPSAGAVSVTDCRVREGRD